MVESEKKILRIDITDIQKLHVENYKMLKYVKGPKKRKIIPMYIYIDWKT